MMKRNLVLIFLCFYSATILGQNPIPQDSTTVLQEVLLLETRKVKNTSGIVPSQIIGDKVFDNYSPIDVVSAINQFPGVYILSGALNTNRITIRGIGARTLFGTDKLRMYYNEIPVTNGSGFSTIEAFDLENISQIEVVKGPKATTFGTNLGGAILLSTKEALGKNTTFSNQMTAGTYDLFKNSFSMRHADNKVSLALSYDHLETNGYRENNRFERDGLFLNATYQTNSKNTLGLLVNYMDYTAQIPSSLGITAFNQNPQQAAFTWGASRGYEANKFTLIGISNTYQFSDRLKNISSLFYNYLDHYEPRPFGILDEYTNGFGFRTRFLGKLNIASMPAEFSFGTELYKDEYNWKEYENLYAQNNGQGSLQGEQIADNKEFRNQLNLFGTLNFTLNTKVQLQLGLNINTTRYDYRDLFNTGEENTSAKRKFKTIALPSATLNYQLNPYHSLYANISRGFSNPTLEETLTPDGVINPDIAQEKGFNYEIGSRQYLLNNKLQLFISLYQMNIKDLLVAERTGDDEFVGRNAGETRHQGMELALNYGWDLTNNFRLTPFLSYTYSNHSFIEFVDEENDYSGNPLTGVPKHRINSGLQMQFKNQFFWNTTHQYVSSIPLTDANSLRSDSFHVFTTKWRYELGLGAHWTLGTAVGINNLFNVKYAQSVLINTMAFGGAEPRYYYPGNDRNYYGSILLRYSL